MAAMVCGRLSVGEHNWGGKPREPAEQAALEKIGMIVEGVVRDAEFRNGAYQGHTLFSVLRSEWDECRG